MNLARPLLILLLLALPAIAEDSPIASLERLLTPIIRKHYPDAQIQVNATSYIAKHGTMEFSVHGSSMTGEISPKAHLEEGPNYKGFLLRIELQDGPYRGQGEVPQDLHKPYWTTFIDARKVPGHDQHLFIGFSYGGRLKKELKPAILDALLAFAGEPTLTTAQVIELANATAKAKKVSLDSLLAPKATYDPKTNTWRVFYSSRDGPADDYLDIRVDDKTKETKLVPGG